MKFTSLFIVVVGVMVIEGLILALVFFSGNLKRKIYIQIGTEYDHTVETIKDEKKNQTELEERQQFKKYFDICPLSVVKFEKVMLSISCENTLRYLK